MIHRKIEEVGYCSVKVKLPIVAGDSEEGVGRRHSRLKCIPGNIVRPRVTDKAEYGQMMELFGYKRAW